MLGEGGEGTEDYYITIRGEGKTPFIRILTVKPQKRTLKNSRGHLCRGVDLAYGTENSANANFLVTRSQILAATEEVIENILLVVLA